MATIKSQIDSYRTGTTNLLSKLSIDGALYNIKDPAVDALAGYVDTAIAGVQSQITDATTFTPVSKDSNAGKFATSVTQDAKGKITVAYSNVRDAALDNVAAVNKIISSLTQAVDGQVSYTVTDLVASNVGSNTIAASNTSIGITATDVQSAIAELATGVQTSKAEAITAAQQKINELAGTDWTAQAGTVKNIIDELSQSGVAGLDTMVDKIRDDFTYGPDGNQSTSVKGYVDGEISRLSGLVSGVSVQAHGDELVNASVDDTGRIVTVGAQSALEDAVGYAKSALQTVTGETDTNALISVNEKSGNDGAKTSAVSATTKLTNAVAAAETAVQTVTNANDALISVSQSGTTATISSSSNLQTAVTAANNALPAAKVAKDKITYLYSGGYSSETLSFTTVTDRDIVVPTTSW